MNIKKHGQIFVNIANHMERTVNKFQEVMDYYKNKKIIF